MKQVLTVVAKLQPTPEQASKMQATLEAFAAACNFVNDNTEPRLTNKIAIQSLVYQSIRERYGLVANMAVRVCARVAMNRKAAKVKKRTVAHFDATSMDLDKDLFRFIEATETVSLATIQGREKVRLQLGNYQRGKLKGRKPTSAQLCLHKDGLFYLHIQLKDETPDPIRSNRVIGVDFGRREIAVTSEGEGWDGEGIRNVRDRFSRVRASLQRKASKGTRSTRRRARQVLKRLSGRERRYQADLNHCISKRIIARAKESGSIVAIEDLTGIRERTNKQPRNKTERRRSNSWAFYQLRTFLEYKGAVSGVEVVPVPPAYTSQMCHQCLHIGLRSDKRFACTNCGWKGDADLNGAMNIAQLGAAVTRLRGPLCCSLEQQAGLLQAPGF